MENDTVLVNNLASFDHLPAIKRTLMNTLAKIHYGKLHVHLDGESYVCGNDDSITASLHIHRPIKMAWRAMTKGDLGIAEAYLEGDWSSDSVTQVLKLFLKNRSKLGKDYSGKKWLRASANFYHKLKKNNLKGSRKNIAYHYDLGNDFYELWLDKSMTYSSALFDDLEPAHNTESGDHILFEAQQNKYQRILDELDIADESSSILEIGCGWGGFAEKALNAGHSIHGITLSEEQLNYAEKRLKTHGDKANLELRDYRHINQQYDNIVSIEMFEAVGESYWQTYFETLKRSLKPSGKIVLQIITIKDQYFDFYKSRADFIQRYIFPGGMLPSDNVLETLVEQNGFQIDKNLSFGHHYGKSLALWEEKFKEVIPEVKAMGYDQRFINMWEYYLAYCQAGFAEERIDVVQLTLSHKDMK